MKVKNLKILTIVFASILFGVAIANQQKTKLPSPAIIPSPEVTPQTIPDDLASEENFILNPPSAEASRSALDKHAQTVAKLAKNGDALEINNCQPSPLVLKIKQGSEFTIKNNDKTSHTIFFDEEHKYILSDSGNMVIKAQFKYGAGDYGYVCMGSGLVGFLHITP